MRDVAIIGGGILGACISYWISATHDADVCVIEKEPDVARHASSRNTGVVHTPFYMDPGRAKSLAGAALASRPMWKKLAKEQGIAWRETGLLELALDESQHMTLKKYGRWAQKNGVEPGKIDLLDGPDVARIEPGVKCHSAIHVSSEAATDFGALARAVRTESERLGTRFVTGNEATGLYPGGVLLGKEKMEARLVVNCAGGNSLDIAKMAGLAYGYTDLHFRGEYWTAGAQHANLAGTTIYTVPENPGYPFLDPHWIRRADGSAEVGPNAVPVPGPEVYEGYVGDLAESIAKLADVVAGGARKLITSPEFVSLASKEWLSSISKTAMIRRVQRFLPGIRPSFFTRRGTAGIRSPVVTPDGKLLGDVMELGGDDSFHIINYNSPGATGAPAYAESLVERLRDRGMIQCKEARRDSVWTPRDQG